MFKTIEIYFQNIEWFFFFLYFILLIDSSALGCCEKIFFLLNCTVVTTHIQNYALAIFFIFLFGCRTWSNLHTQFNSIQSTFNSFSINWNPKQQVQRYNLCIWKDVKNPQTHTFSLLFFCSRKIGLFIVYYPSFAFTWTIYSFVRVQSIKNHFNTESGLKCGGGEKIKYANRNEWTTHQLTLPSSVITISNGTTYNTILKEAEDENHSEKYQKFGWHYTLMWNDVMAGSFHVNLFKITIDFPFNTMDGFFIGIM